MNPLTNFTTLGAQRDLTDASLVSERGKTDHSFQAVRDKAETNTDARVKDDRKKADFVRHSDRLEEDNEIRTARLDINGLALSRTRAQDRVDSSLSRQRATDDAAVMAERVLMDQAMVDERVVLTAEVNKFLEAGRKNTDQSLFKERSRTDQDAVHSLELLTIETLRHTATKAELTTRDEFLAIVSHDLRNPIGSILSYADLALEENLTNYPDLKNWMQSIKRNAEVSLRLITDILDMERFAEGKFQIRLVPVDFDRIMLETIESFQCAAAEKQIRIGQTITKPLGILNVDRDRLAQVLSNLIGNALKFTPAGGSILLSATKSANELKVSVKDSGNGIAKEKRLAIFERFAQIHDKDRSGLGLGLYISAMFIEAYGGKLWVESGEAVGSTFTFTIPLSAELSATLN